MALIGSDVDRTDALAELADDDPANKGTDQPEIPAIEPGVRGRSGRIGAPHQQQPAAMTDWREQLRERVREIRARKRAAQEWQEQSPLAKSTPSHEGSATTVDPAAMSDQTESLTPQTELPSDQPESLSGQTELNHRLESPSDRAVDPEPALQADDILKPEDTEPFTDFLLVGEFHGGFHRPQLSETTTKDIERPDGRSVLDEPELPALRHPSPGPGELPITETLPEDAPSAAGHGHGIGAKRRSTPSLASKEPMVQPQPYEPEAVSAPAAESVFDPEFTADQVTPREAYGTDDLQPNETGSVPLTWDEASLDPEAILSAQTNHADPAAPLGDRVAAALADSMVLALLGILLVASGAMASGSTWQMMLRTAALPLFAALTLFGMAYGVFFVGTCGQTLGKMVMRVRVIGAEQFKVGYLQAAWRTTAYLLATLPAGIGLLLAFKDIDHRALHDRLSGTRVVKS